MKSSRQGRIQLKIGNKEVLKGLNRGEPTNWQDLYYQMQQQKNFFKQQYEKLYESYSQKKQKIKEYKHFKKYIKQLEDKVRILEHTIEQQQGFSRKSKLKIGVFQNQQQDIKQLKKQNQSLTQKLIEKNDQLQQVYTKLQQEMTKQVKSHSRCTQQNQLLQIMKINMLTNIQKNYDQLKKQTSSSASKLITQQIQIPPPIQRIVSMPPFVNAPINSFMNKPIPNQQVQFYHPNLSSNNFGIIPQQFISNNHSPIQTMSQIKVNEMNSSLIPNSDILAPSAAVQFCPINSKTLNIK